MADTSIDTLMSFPIMQPMGTFLSTVWLFSALVSDSPYTNDMEANINEE
jgi:hypothetical protein